MQIVWVGDSWLGIKKVGHQNSGAPLPPKKVRGPWDHAPSSRTVIDLKANKTGSMISSTLLKQATQTVYTTTMKMEHRKPK